MARRAYGTARRLVHLLVAIGLLSGVPACAAGPLIWAFGDSLTAGYGLPPAEGFTRQLEAALRHSGVQATVRNGGVSGDTAAQGRARLLWGLRGLGAKPDLVIVELGANDMLRGLPVASARANLDAIMVELDHRHIAVLLAGMKASPNLGLSYVTSFDEMYPALARAHRIMFYPFFLDGVAGRRALLQPDGLHPNALGVGVIVRRILPSIRRALSPPRRGRRNERARAAPKSLRSALRRVFMEPAREKVELKYADTGDCPAVETQVRLMIAFGTTKDVALR